MDQKIDTSLIRLVEEAKHFPMLTIENEQELARAWLNKQDPDALRQLVGSHLRLVIKVARGYIGYGLPLADLVSEGNVGLMQAAEKFDPDRGFRFSTYALWWIRAAIQEYILHSWSLVKMGTTAAQKKLFFNLRRIKSRLAELEQGDLSPETVKAIAIELDVPENEVVDMNRRLSAADSSLNATLGKEGDSEWLEMLQEEPSTLEELSHRYAVSRERIRQIEVRAFGKLQRAMRSKAPVARQDNSPRAVA